MNEVLRLRNALWTIKEEAKLFPVANNFRQVVRKIAEDALAQSQQPVAPIGVELAGVISLLEGVKGSLEVLEADNSAMYKDLVQALSDLEKFLALPQTEKGEMEADRDALRMFIADLHTVAVMGDGCLPGEQMRQMKALIEGFK